MAILSMHVLNTMLGRPAAGLRIDMMRNSEIVMRFTTNEDGRAGHGSDLAGGVYQFIYHAGEYFRSLGVDLAAPAFFDEVVIRCVVRDGREKYHIPLLLSPFGYTTYRGS